MILGVTGHRPPKVGGYEENNLTAHLIKKKMRQSILAHEPEQLITGMALGVDTWAAEIAIELNIPFVAAIPFMGQQLKWPSAAQSRYLQLIDRATAVKVVCKGGYAVWKMQERNEWIIWHCDLLLAVWDKSPEGGTFKCITAAQKQEKPIELITPEDIVCIHTTMSELQSDQHVF